MEQIPCSAIFFNPNNLGMKHKHQILLAAAGFIALWQPLSAQTETVDLCKHITGNGRVVISMPEKLRERIKCEKAPVVHEPESHSVEKPVATGRMGGYRIQVFSDNNSRTAKGEARSRAHNISSQFPNYQTYVIYNSPFWRLRVGNFRTADEANAAADELKSSFPQYAKEIRVVRDRITVDAE